MSLALDPQTERRIQHETERGAFTGPDELINRALDLLVADQSWPDEEKAELDARYDRAMAGLDRGEGIPGEKLREVLAQRRAARVA